MFSHTIPCFKVPATLFTANIGIFHVFSLNVPPYVSLSLHNSTHSTGPQATTYAHHLRFCQRVQELTCESRQSKEKVGNLTLDIYLRILQDLLVWL